MAQYDVHRRVGRAQLLLDCQSDLLWDLSTRFVIPLLPITAMPAATVRLNPRFWVEDHEMVLMTQSAAAIRRDALGEVVTSLSGHFHEIGRAIDFLLTGV